MLKYKYKQKQGKKWKKKMDPTANFSRQHWKFTYKLYFT